MSQETDIRAIIWDLGGVLVRTDDFRPREQLAASLGMTRADLETLVFSGTSGSRAQNGEIDVTQHWENVRAALKLSPQEIGAFQDTFWSGDRLDTALVDYIRSLRGSYRTALLSNAFSDLRRAVEEVWHIQDAFDKIIISAEVGMTKPDQRIYRLALERIGAEPQEAVFIDDFTWNIDGARKAGLHTIHFQYPDQARADLEQLLDNHKPAGI
jgi:epoxide hydrolase-like predicted phosphatase